MSVRNAPWPGGRGRTTRARSRIAPVPVAPAKTGGAEQPVAGETGRDDVLCCTHLGVMSCRRGRQAQSRRTFTNMLIGLTGGIGCGKSSAAVCFAAAGFRVRDTDRIVREQVLTDPAVLNAARDRWGAAAIAADGQLNRAEVAAVVFARPAERLWWESVVHPRVGRLWRGEVAADPGAEWVIEVPLLFEAGLEKGFDFVVCVGANPATQLARVTARGMTQAQAEQRIASQFPLAHKLNSAHAVLWNEGSRDFRHSQVERLARQLRGLGTR
jgi:dephospho-CoA kinase